MAKSTRLFRGGVSIAAVVTSLSSPAAAEPAGGQAGATSRATLTIAVSVAPRAGVRWAAGRSAPTKDAVLGQWCAWSTSALRALSIELQPTGRRLAPALPIRVETGRSPADCEANDALRLRIAHLRALAPAGTTLLLIAPE